MRKYPHLDLTSRELTPEYLQSRDCILIVTDHSAYDWQHVVRYSKLIVDTRNATGQVHDQREKIVRA